LSTIIGIIGVIFPRRSKRLNLPTEGGKMGPMESKQLMFPPRSESQKIIHNLKHPEMGNVNDRTIMRLSKTMIMATAKIITT
jgi:hypothetical protein